MEKDLYGLGPVLSATPKLEATKEIQENSPAQVLLTDTKSTKQLEAVKQTLLNAQLLENARQDQKSKKSEAKVGKLGSRKQSESSLALLSSKAVGYQPLKPKKLVLRPMTMLGDAKNSKSRSPQKRTMALKLIKPS